MITLRQCNKQQGAGAYKGNTNVQRYEDIPFRLQHNGARPLHPQIKPFIYVVSVFDIRTFVVIQTYKDNTLQRN